MSANPVTSWLRAIAIFLYSLAMSALAPLALFASRFSPRVRAQVAGRAPLCRLTAEVARTRAHFARSVVFFCSSAGEYEQAKPLISRLTVRGDVYVHVVFFSRSGSDYAAVRKETVPYSLSYVDSAFEWGSFFAAARPNVVAVVRHELWPAFLHTARQYGRLCLIDAGAKDEGEVPLWKRFVRAQLYGLFDRVYLVARTDGEVFREAYGVEEARMKVVGDTKYDRAIERTRAAAQESAGLRQLLDRAGVPAKGRLVVGSAHKPDLEVVLAARAAIGKDEAGSWQLVVAPHDVSPAMIEAMEATCASAGLKVVRFSQLASPGAGLFDVILVDAMGKLAELYASGTAAFVGGATHHQVHNVLEPASHGLALAFGPLYKNSSEAVQLVDAGLAHVCGDAAALAGWWRGAAAGREAERERLLATVAGLTGATERILEDWKATLGR